MTFFQIVLLAFALALTIASYWIGLHCYRLGKRNPILQPIVIGCAVVIAVLLLTPLDFATYHKANQPLLWLLGPATIALAIPLYQNLKTIRSLLLPIICTLLVGGAFTVLVAVAILYWLDGSGPAIISMSTKSITTPFAVAVTETLGGIAAVSAVLVIITGALGAIMIVPLLRRIGIEDDATTGVTLGLAAHAIGTATALEKNHTCGAFAVVSMVLTGVLTAVLLPLIAAAMG